MPVGGATDKSRDGNGRVVVLGARQELAIGRPATGGHRRHADIEDELRRLQAGLEDVDEEVVDRQTPFAAWSSHAHDSVEDEQRGRRILARIGVREIAAEGSLVADTNGPDDPAGLSQEWPAGRHDPRCSDLGKGRGRPDHQPVVLGGDRPQGRQPPKPDNDLGLHHAERQERDQRRPACNDVAVGPGVGQDRDGIVDRRRLDVSEAAHPVADDRAAAAWTARTIDA